MVECSARRACAAVWLVALGLVSCGSEEPGDGEGAEPAPAAEIWFREEALARGLVFQHRSGHAQEFYFPELMGGGAALFDMDGDGDLDAFLVQSGSVVDATGGDDHHRLFENDGTGHFRDVTTGSGVGVPGYGMGVAAGDYDGDGDVDLYVTNLRANVLLRNDGTGHFTDATQAAGVGDEGWGTSACFFDHDGDGDLDLVVANYLDWSVETELDCFGPSGRADYCGPTTYAAPQRDTLYRNEGDGTFTDVSESAGLSSAFGNGLGVVPGDFDGDGRLDLFVANDQTADQLWHNEGDGTFRNVAEIMGCALDGHGGARAGMGVDAVDIDDDQDLDLIVVHMARQSDGLFRNEGRYFKEDTARAGLAQRSVQSTRFGVGFHDFDLDGTLDLFLANGRVNLLMEPLSDDDPYAEPNLVLRGLPGSRWEPVTPGDGLVQELLATSRGAAFGDVDGDGAVDVLVVNRDGPASLLHNVRGGGGHWLIARVRDARGSDALGASLELRLGDRRVRRDVKPGYSYCSASDPRAHAGLGASERVDEIVVTWVDGGREAYGPFSADQVVELRRGAGRALPE